MKYIDTEKLKELFDKKYKEFREKGYREDATYYYFADGLDVAKQLVESLQHEQPKVDLEEEFADFLEKENAYIDDDSVISYYNRSSFNHTYDIYPIAKHFYELGLKARKEE